MDPKIAAGRIATSLKENILREKSENSKTPEEIYQKITERLISEKKRYQELYGIDHTDQSNFDLVIDTNQNNLQEVVQKIVAEYKKWLEN